MVRVLISLLAITIVGLTTDAELGGGGADGDGNALYCPMQSAVTYCENIPIPRAYLSGIIADSVEALCCQVPDDSSERLQSRGDEKYQRHNSEEESTTE